MDKHVLIELLQNEIVSLTFEKVDGSIRDMKCTRNPSIIEEKTKGTPYAKKLTSDFEIVNVVTTSPNIIRVFDVDSNGWRSFRIEYLNTVNGKNVNDRTIEKNF